MEETERFLKPTPAIDCDNPSIRQKALELTEGQEEAIDKAKGLFYFVRDEIKYNTHSLPDSNEYYKASITLDRKEGFCVQKAVLLAALARAAGIPARLRHADIRNYLLPDKLRELMGTNLFVYHGFNELYIEEKWVKATATFDLKMCQENRLIPVEFDGKNDATFHPRNLDGQMHIEYVKDHGYYDDIPFDEMANAGLHAYGTERLELVKQRGKRRKET